MVNADCLWVRVKIPAFWISCLSLNLWVSLPTLISISWGGNFESQELVCQMRFFTTEKHSLSKEGVKEGGSERRWERWRDRLREEGREGEKKGGRGAGGGKERMPFYPSIFWGKNPLMLLVLLQCKVVCVPMRKSFLFILINTSGFAHTLQQIIVQDQNCTCGSQWPIFCPSPPKLLCSKAKSKQCSTKDCKFLAISLLLHMLPRSPRGEAELSICLLCFFLPISPPSTYVHTDMVYSLYLNSIITLISNRPGVRGSREGDWMWVWVWQGPAALSGR